MDRDKDNKAGSRLDLRTLEMVGDYAVGEEVDPPDKSEGGIIIPKTGKGEKSIYPYQMVKLIAVGPGARLISGERTVPPFAAGQVVLTHAGAGLKIKWGGRDLIVIGEGDVFAVQNPDVITPGK